MIAVQERSAAPSVQPLVSVIVPVYQGERYIVGAVRSALNQTYENLEVFVVDDGSTDQTRARIETLGDRRLRILSQPNGGTAAARNLGLAHARGDYIAFLDSDDRWFPDKISRELSLMKQMNRPGVAYSSYYAVDDRGRLLHDPPLRTDSGDARDWLLDGDDFLMPSLCLFDRCIFDEIGAFRVGRYHEDYEFILRVSQKYPVFATGYRLAVYRQSTAGKFRSLLANFDRARDEKLAVVNDLRGSFSPAEVERLRQNSLRSLLYSFLMYGFDAHARRLLREIDPEALVRGRKGTVAWLFARTGINCMAPGRILIQRSNLALRQRSWRKRLARSGLELRYE